VQPAEPLDAGGDRALPARFLGDVQGDEQRRVAQFGRKRSALGLVAVGHDRLATLAGD
jgi:hypothetical protein